MNGIETKLISLLEVLKSDYHAAGIKAEFESEGTRFEEALYLKKIASAAELDFVIKTGGCGALRDVYDSKSIGAKTIVAPMIESSYAVEKYVKTVKKVFSDEEIANLNLMINIETEESCKRLQEILTSEYSSYINGIVMGRTDMAASMGDSEIEINSEKILKIAEKIALAAKKYNKKFIVGGSVSPLSIPFFENLKNVMLSGFETRKVVFNVDAVADNKAESAILKAFEFEILWLKSKKDLFGITFPEDNIRIKTLEARYKEILQV